MIRNSNAKEVKTVDFLKTLWPTPFKIEKGNVSGFIVQLIIFIVICAVIGALIGLLAALPIIGIIFSILGGLMELYGLVGVVLCILQFAGVFDKQS